MVTCMDVSLPSAPTNFWSSVVPSAVSEYTRVALFGAMPLNFDFATLRFQDPTTASAANAVAPRNSVLSRAIATILPMSRLPWMFWSCFVGNAARLAGTRIGEYARAAACLQALHRRALQHGAGRDYGPAAWAVNRIGV